jgi:hypothetical protein
MNKLGNPSSAAMTAPALMMELERLLIGESSVFAVS